MDTVSNALASIYNLSEFNNGSFDFNMLLGSLNNEYSGTFMANILNSLKILGISAAIVLFVMFLLNFIKTGKIIRAKSDLLKTATPPEAAKESPLGSRWEEIQKHLNSSKEAEGKFAVIEADSLVDYILKSAGYPGDTMGNRLKNIDKTQIVTLDGLWEAHKIRNRLAHDVSYFLRYGEAKRAVQLYEKTLKELNAL